MYGLETIKAMNRTAMRKAKQDGKQPLVFNGNCEMLKKIPNLGDYRATKYGWKMDKVYFVDSSGMGRVGERALTFNQFCKKCVIGKGYAIIEAGQFQVRIGEFRKVK